nr:hypothetical protein Iba_chr05dCG12200 [Ipomoea batatas]
MIMLLGKVLGRYQNFYSNEFETLALKTGYYLCNQAPLHSIRLDCYKGALHLENTCFLLLEHVSCRRKSKETRNPSSRGICGLFPTVGGKRRHNSSERNSSSSSCCSPSCNYKASEEHLHCKTPFFFLTYNY